MLVHIFLHFLLGPIGWILSAAMSRNKEDDSQTKVVKKSVKVKLSQCLLCKGTEVPQVVDVQIQPKALMFRVHPRYSTALDAEKIKLDD